MKSTSPSTVIWILGLVTGIATYVVMDNRGANTVLAIAVGLATFIVMTGALTLGRRS